MEHSYINELAVILEKKDENEQNQIFVNPFNN